jgi:HK97 gp10 family phage protein
MVFKIDDFHIKIDANAIEGLEGSDQVFAAIVTLSQAGEAAAKEHAPVDTGNLRRSITHEVNGGRHPVGRVGTNVRYGIYQELGTRHHAAHPFMRPAIEIVRRLMKGF